MKEVLEREIIIAFSNVAMDVSSLAKLCANLDDEESREETSSFLNRQWREVSPKYWKNYYCAFYFFTDQAFHYYTPSVMLSALSNFDETHLAVATLLSSLQTNEDKEMEKWNKARWLRFTSEQLDVVIKWLDYIKNSLHEYGFNSECEIAISFLKHAKIQRG